MRALRLLSAQYLIPFFVGHNVSFTGGRIVGEHHVIIPTFILSHHAWYKEVSEERGRYMWVMRPCLRDGIKALAQPP